MGEKDNVAKGSTTCWIAWPYLCVGMEDLVGTKGRVIGCGYRSVPSEWDQLHARWVHFYPKPRVILV